MQREFFAYTNKSKHDILMVVSLRKNNGFLGKILAKILSPILGPILSPILGPILGPVHGSSPCFVLCPNITIQLLTFLLGSLLDPPPPCIS